MNRPEVLSFLRSFAGLENAPDGTEIKPFLELVSSLRRDLPLSIPLLRSLAALALGKSSGTGLLERRLERRYRRLCKIYGELGRLDFRKAGAGMSPEDYVFSQIDFSRYKKIDEKEFDLLFQEGPDDFDEAFYKNNFGNGKDEIQTIIRESYRKEEGYYKIQRENPLILSVMRTLDTSPESADLFSAEELQGELDNLLDFTGGEKNSGGPPAGSRPFLSGTEHLYQQLVLSLNNKIITHEDGMTTTLFISQAGDLSGTFRPGNKAWTLVLIPAAKF